jgi:hypothetical protein
MQVQLNNFLKVQIKFLKNIFSSQIRSLLLKFKRAAEVGNHVIVGFTSKYAISVYYTYSVTLTQVVISSKMSLNFIKIKKTYILGVSVRYIKMKINVLLYCKG